MKTLEETRQSISAIDLQMLNLFEQRMHLAAEAAAYKKEHHLPLTNLQREAEILNNVETLLKDKDLSPYCRQLFEKLISLSKTYQQQTTGLI